MKHFMAHLNDSFTKRLLFLTSVFEFAFTCSIASATIVLLILNFRLMREDENFVC